MYNVTVGDVTRLALLANQTHQFNVVANNTLNEWEGFVIQGHAQLRKLVLSSTPEFGYGDSAEGTGVGLWQGLKKGTVCENAFYLKMSVSTNVTVMVLIAVVAIEAEGTHNYHNY